MEVKEGKLIRVKKLIFSRLGTLLIAAGMVIAASPFILRAYNSMLYPPPPVQEELKDILTEVGEELYASFAEEKTEDEDEETCASCEQEAEETEDYPQKFVVTGTSVLYIPKLDVMTNLNYGVELEDLKKIPGIYPQSGYPDTGNVSIAAHRDAWFKDLDKLEAGDEIRLYYNGKVYIYAVHEVFITHSRDWSVIEPAAKPALTLTTCHPPGLGAAPYRLIARAYLERVIKITE